MRISRHEWRFMAMMVLVTINIVATCILGMAVSSAIEAGQMPVVPRDFIDSWAWISIFVSPFIMVAGMTPAGRKDILSWK